MIFERFFPLYEFKSVESIPFDLLDKENIKAVIFDMDNTLVDNKYKYNEDLKKWLMILKQKGIKFCILSNSPRKSKAEKIGYELDMGYIINASKPWSNGFKKAINLLNVDKKNVAIIGDQIFTDIWGGNRFGIKTILVNPIAKKEWIFTRIKRPIEKYIIKKYNKEQKEVK